MNNKNNIFIGVAGWNVPKPHAELFPVEGSHLERYACKFNAVEINTSFYKVHQPKTYIRWAESVPENFKFSVKMYQEFTHKKKFEIDLNEVHENIQGIMGLGKKLGTILVQIPGRFQFVEELASDFFSCLRDSYDGPIVFEPRNETWAQDESIQILERNKIALVNADPSKCSFTMIRSAPINYFRLHGSPKMYESSYEFEYLQNLKNEVLELSKHKETWVIFDNTKYFAATENANTLSNMLFKEDRQECTTYPDL